MDTKYMHRKGIQVIPPAMAFSLESARFLSDGTRIAYLNGNMSIKPAEGRARAVNRLQNKRLAAVDTKQNPSYPL